MLTAIYSIIVVILSNELVVADECILYQFKSPFYPGESCDDIYTKNPESHEKSGYYWITDGPRKVYCGMTYTGSSCEYIYNNNPETRDKSGYYRVNSNQWTYCNMTAIAADNFIPTCAGVGGGWRKIAQIDVSAGDNCPSGWSKATESGVSFCRVISNSSNTCSSTYFPTHGISYQRVCGKARGYQKGHSIGFLGLSTTSMIDSVYLSGLSITYGSSPRQHIWTYVTGFSEIYSFPYNCACAQYAGDPAPSFVGSNYYCESGTSVTYPSTSTYYFSDPLWDNTGCVNSNCCNNPTQPWFHRLLSQPTQDDIEARICTNGPFYTYESTLIDQLELYIQ